MSRTEVPNKNPSRAERLQREAGNCLGVAVNTGKPDLAADLIDEAIKLVRRSQEIAADPASDRRGKPTAIPR